MAKTKVAATLLLLLMLQTIDVAAVGYDTSNCSSGKYLREGKFCTTCQPGFYCPGGSFQLPFKCLPGKYSGFAASVCTVCPNGHSCNNPAVPPIPCNTGQYSTNGGTTCSNCPNGYRCNPDGTVTQCTVGEDCTDWLDIKAVKVEAGKTQISPASSPTACASGSFSLAGSKTCTVCPAGSMCPDARHPAIACPAGMYQPQEGQATCLICPKGSFCSTGGNQLPERCALGQFAASDGSKACTACPAGSQCLDPTIGPVACLENQYSPASSTLCYTCPPGYECLTNRDTTGAPIACTAGFYSLAGDMFCSKCPVGYFCSTTNNNPFPCAPGTTTNGLSGKTYCDTCPVGKDCSLPGQATTCPFGTFATAGSSKCQACPFGHYVTAAGVVTKCLEGFVVNQVRTACIDCPPGYECPGGEFSRMLMCQPGYYAASSGTNKSPGYCTVCPAGSFCSKQDALPVACPDGWWADIGMTYCNRCPPGQTCKDKTGRHNIDCPNGYYYDWDDKYGACKIFDQACATVSSAYCVKCPKGSFCPVAMGGDRSITAGKTNSVQTCVDGTWAPDYATQCNIAEPGWSPTAIKDMQQTCAVTEFSYGGNQICTTCPKGHECTFLKTAVPCPIMFTSAQGAQDCSQCTAGKDCRNLKLTKSLGGTQTAEVPTMNDWQDPVACAAGFYTMPHNFYCVPCPIGHSCASGALTPTMCVPGTYAGQQQSSCTACPTEYWSDQGQEYCTPVPPGMKTITTVPGFDICAHKTYSMWGENTCSTCPDGWLCTKGHNYPYDWAYSCPQGSYCAAGAQTKCPKGYFGVMERAKTLAEGCSLCPAGYDCQEGTEHFLQVPCPLGYYCPATKAYAHPCPSGTYGENLFGRSLADCVTCAVGTQCTQGNPGRGSPCEEGYYCPSGSSVRQYPCPAGTYGAYKTGKRDLSECLPCPPGNYCPQATATPTPAPIGYYSTLSGMPALESLLKCPPKYYCPNTAMTSYKSYPCPIGYYCPLGTSLLNQYPCPEGTYSDRQELHDPIECLQCPKGFQCAAASTTASLQLVSGGKMAGECTQHHYCPVGTKASAIPNCPAGTYAPYYRSLSVTDCLKCPPGSFCDSGAGPQNCPMGYYCPEGTENYHQFPCPPGYYQDQTNRWSLYHCKPCGIGNACPTQGMTTLASVKCPDGFYNNASTVAESCSICPAGYYCKDLMIGASPMSPHPIPCAKGTYSASGAIACSYCNLGTFCPLEGTTDTQMKLNLCPRGTFCSRTIIGVSYGLDVYPNKDDHGCPQYYYCPPGTTMKMPIPPGTMIKVTGAENLSSAVQIPAGWFAKEFSDATLEAGTQVLGYTSSTTCNPGNYCPPGSYEQVKCPAGTFRAGYYGRNVSDCGKCPGGTYCPTTGISVPLDCPMGGFCPEGSINVTPCPRGTYNPALNKYDSRDCTKCDPGFYCPYLGQTDVDITLHQCDKGFLCLGGSNRPEPTDGVSGKECPTGYYCITAQGAVGTLDATKNAWATGPSKAGLGKPQSCLAGQQGLYTRAFQIADCIACLPGYYCPGSGGTSPAIACTEGYFCPSPYPTGQTNLGVADTPSNVLSGGVQLLQAGLGYYAPLGYYKQIPCNIGTYTDIKGQSACKGCPAGTFCNVPQISSPTTTNPCPAGYWCISFDETQQLCSNPGTIDSSLCYFEQVLYKCPVGTYAGPFAAGISPTSKIKASECVACPSGKACPEEAMSIDTSTLPLCGPGYFCISSATTRYPTSLAPGKYGPCPAGYFCPEGTGDYSANACPKGTFSNQERATDNSYCIPCPPGYMCESTALTAPQSACAAGTTCSYSGTFPTYTLVVAQCTANHYCPIGSYNELICPAGFFQLDPSIGYCQPCPAGSFCINGQQSNCLKGYYCM